MLYVIAFNALGIVGVAVACIIQVAVIYLYIIGILYGNYSGILVLAVIGR